MEENTEANTIQVSHKGGGQGRIAVGAMDRVRLPQKTWH